jgi:hypothetical protein
VKVLMPDGTDFEDAMKEWEEELEKKNFRNWLNKRFPNSYAGHYNSYHAITHPWLFVENWKHQIKWAWQRVFRGWDDRAVWAVNDYLSKLIPQLLMELKEKKHGIPASVFDDEPEELEMGMIGYTDESMEKAEEKWNGILDTIAEGFNEYNRANEELLSGDEWNEMEEKVSESFRLLEKYFQNLLD